MELEPAGPRNPLFDFPMWAPQAGTMPWGNPRMDQAPRTCAFPCHALSAMEGVRGIGTRRMMPSTDIWLRSENLGPCPPWMEEVGPPWVEKLESSWVEKGQHRVPIGWSSGDDPKLSDLTLTDLSVQCRISSDFCEL